MIFKRTQLIRACLLGSCCLLLTGCVYLRLLDLKKQLGSFSENVEMDYDQATKFILKNPVLLAKDMVWMMQQQPTSQQLDKGAQKWIYWFEKQYQEGASEEADFDIRLGMVFEEDMLRELWFPLRYQEIMGEELLLGVFEDVKYAEDNEKKLSTKWSWYTGAPSFGNIGEFIRILGDPYSRSEEDGVITMAYYYDLKIRSEPLKPGEHDHSLVFTFDKDSSKMQSAHVVMGRLRLTIDLESGVKIKI